MSFIFADEGTRFNIVFVDALSIKVKPSIKAKSLFDKEAIVVLRITNLQTTGTSIRVNNKDELSFHYYVIFFTDRRFCLWKSTVALHYSVQSTTIIYYNV